MWREILKLEEFERQEREREKRLMWDETPPQSANDLKGGKDAPEAQSDRFCQVSKVVSKSRAGLRTDKGSGGEAPGGRFAEAADQSSNPAPPAE